MATTRIGSNTGSIGSGSQSLERVSLSEQALKVLRQSLVAGDIRPGEIYSAAALAGQLGVSNSPVREAMLTLVNDGLMVAVRNRGYQVVPITKEELHDIQDLRVMIEVPTMVEVARRHAEFDLAPFGAVAEQIVDAADRGDITAYLERDREFHLGLTALVDNSRLTKLVGNLRDQTRLYGLHGLFEEGRLLGSAREHLDIFAAIEAGDTGETERQMTKHLEHITKEWSSD